MGVSPPTSLAHATASTAAGSSEKLPVISSTMSITAKGTGPEDA